MHRDPQPVDQAVVPEALVATLSRSDGGAGGTGVRVFRSEALFAGGMEVRILHGEATYRLRRTSLGKLILIK